jgi:3-oxoacyl-[acyl-carrier protein] reductase
LSSKNLLLMGASGGLGRRFAAELAKSSGYNFILHYYHNRENIRKLEDNLKSTGVKYKSYHADISSEEEVKSLIDSAENDFGSIDILINNAGISMDSVSWKMSKETWERVIGVNLTGAFLCIKYVLPQMRNKNWGRIVNISSVVPQVGVAGTAAYSASKAGIFGLTKSIAKEIANKNITINTIALGYFNEGMISQVPDELKKQIKSSIPKNEFGDPIDIVNCIRFLIDDNSSYITGQTININGGLY